MSNIVYMNKTQRILQKFVEEKGLKPGDVLLFEKYRELFKEVDERFGKEVYAYFMDCFMPQGEAVDPGYEDSLEEYVFEGLEE